MRAIPFHLYNMRKFIYQMKRTMNFQCNSNLESKIKKRGMIIINFLCYNNRK